MTDFQPGIFDKQHRLHLFAEFVRRDGVTAETLRTQLLELQQQVPEGLTLTLALGPDLWQLLDGSFSFPPFSLEGRVRATQGDLLLWIQGDDRGDIFDLIMAASECLSSSMESQLELDAFVYHDSRDITGFVDGIGNPKGDKALAAALVPEGSPGAGGSFVLTQKWVHDLAAFKALPVAEQERVIGRTKEDAVEFSDDEMPVNAHVGRTDVAHNGVPQKIWRRSVPYGNSSEHGIFFVAFSCELERFDYLLRRMFGMADDDVTDRLLEFSQPVTSSWWYAPTRSWLETCQAG